MNGHVGIHSGPKALIIQNGNAAETGWIFAVRENL